MLGIVLGVYIGAIVALNIPYVQQKLTVFVAEELADKLGTKLTIGRIDIGLLNRIIIDDVLLDDKSGKEMLKVTRLSAKFDILPLFRGKISISSVQLFGFNISLNKRTPEADPNFKFLIDAFTSKDTVKSKSNIDLRINSILIRRGKLSYDVFSELGTPGTFNAKHIRLHNIIANISLKAFQKDSINAYIKRLSVDEQSGFELRKLSLKVLANDKKMRIENFAVDLPNSSLRMDTIRMKYDSLASFKHFIDDVHFSLSMLPSHITLQDISPFVPVLSNFKEKMDIEMDVAGSINQLNFSRLYINVQNRLKIKGNLSLQDLSRSQDTYIYGNLSDLSINSEGINFIARNLGEKFSDVSPLLKRLGNISFRGEISGYYTDLVTYGMFKTSLGSVKTDLKLSSNKEKGTFAYSGSVKTTDFEIGKLLANDKLGKTTLNIDVKGSHQKAQFPSIVMKGLISSIEYSKYKYENIALDGEYKEGGYDGKLAINDANGSIMLNGSFNTVEKIPTFNFKAIVDKVRPHELNLTQKYRDTEFSLTINANFKGGSIDEMYGEINIDSLKFDAPDKTFFMDNMNILATHESGKKKLSIQSSFLRASIEGSYSYRTITASVMNIMKKYMPSLVPKHVDVATKNNFSFDIHIFNTDILSSVFDIPLSVDSHSTIKGYFNDNAKRLRIEGYFPKMRYGNLSVESGLIICENPTDLITGHIRFTSKRKTSEVNISLDAQAKNDIISTTFNWGNNGTETYSGKLAAVSHLGRYINRLGNSTLKAVVNVQPTDIILNDTVWQIHPSNIVADSGKIAINNFYFSHKEQFIRINGDASANLNDTVKVDMKEINIAYVFDIVNLKGIYFKGLASGTAYVNHAMKKPIMNTRLFVKNFGFNDGLLGDMNIYGEWDDKNEGIFLDAKIKEQGVSATNVSGYIYPLKPKSGIDLRIQADSTNLKFLEYYVKSIVSDIKGRASGKIHLFGKFSALNLEGSVKPDASFKVNILNAQFALKDSVRISPEAFTLDNIPMYDLEGHRGIANGYIHHRNLKNMSYKLEFKANNMLVMNTKESSSVPFYGKVYGTGNALLTGNQQQGLSVDAAITTNRNTNFVYVAGATASATNNQFIKFIDKTQKRVVEDSIDEESGHNIEQKLKEDEPPMDVRLNILVDATPDATMKIIMDPIAGDYISGKGSGNIRTEYYNKGDVKMFGNYRISQGVYKFSLQEVIRKDFIIKDGSEISFNGNPLDANMNIQAVYTVNSASLNDLMSDVSDFTKQPNVKVNCIMNLTGVLLRPDIKMGIELPNESDEVQTLVRNYISTDEQMNMQILYLLSIGKFYTAENVNTTQNSNLMSSVLSSTLSGQLNNMLSNIMNNNNWNFGTNLSTGDKGWTDVEVEGVLSAQLLNNRLLVNGNFGYRDNPLSTTNFVGDFQAEWLLTRSGDIRLKAYNETNDKYYTRTNLTTQGVGVMYKKDFNKWKELFFWNNWSKKKKKTKTEAVDKAPTDTIPEARSTIKRTK